MPRVNDQIGPYQLSKKLGKGAFGEVWLAKNITALVAREVALKIPHDEDVDLDTIKQEAAIWLAASGHSNVLPFIEANVYEDYVVIVSEYAPDGSLQSWLKQNGGRAPSIESALEMTRGVLHGLAHLHSRNIIHRDLKPDNVLLQGATPRITDFGISRVFKSTSHSAVSAGTPVYMAPEAYNARRNQQTDVWSVGVMLYQMLAGRLPFTGESYGEVMKAVFEKEPHPLPASVPQWLQQVVAKAMAKKPEARYFTAIEMLSALQVTSTPFQVLPIPQHDDSELTRYAAPKNFAQNQFEVPLASPSLGLGRNDKKASSTLRNIVVVTTAFLLSSASILTAWGWFGGGMGKSSPSVTVNVLPSASVESLQAQRNSTSSTASLSRDSVSPPVAQGILIPKNNPQQPTLTSPAPRPTTTLVPQQINKTNMLRMTPPAPTPIQIGRAHV